jgi:hypothetical protein
MQSVGPRMRTTCRGGTGDCDRDLGSGADGVVHDDNDEGDEALAGESAAGAGKYSRWRGWTLAGRTIFVLAELRLEQRLILFGLCVTVDGDGGGDSYSPLGDFELVLGGSDDNNLGYDGHCGDDDSNIGGGDGDGYYRAGQYTGRTGDQTNRQAGGLAGKKTGRQVLVRRSA